MAFLLTLFGGFFLIMASVSSATHRLNTRKYERMKFLATTIFSQITTTAAHEIHHSTDLHPLILRSEEKVVEQDRFFGIVYYLEV
jgi:hypothetical protein